MKRLRVAVPWTLIVLRVLLCPLMIAGARNEWAGGWLGAMVFIALVSDIYDGILARLWGNETPVLRISDSIADTIFYLGAAWALWMRHPVVVRNNWRWFVALFALEGFRYIFDLWKYRKTASYHSYLAKLWGLLLAMAMIGVFALDGNEMLVRVALAVGIVVNLEGLAMSFVLPHWKNDVKTLAMAWRLRKTTINTNPSTEE